MDNQYFLMYFLLGQIVIFSIGSIIFIAYNRNKWRKSGNKMISKNNNLFDYELSLFSFNGLDGLSVEKWHCYQMNIKPFTDKSYFSDNKIEFTVCSDKGVKLAFQVYNANGDVLTQENSFEKFVSINFLDLIEDTVIVKIKNAVLMQNEGLTLNFFTKWNSVGKITSKQLSVI